MEIHPPGAPPEIDLGRQEPLTVEQWERIAHFLFNRLDDIDTYTDIVKDNDHLFRQQALLVAQARFEVGRTDGYRVVFRPRK